MRSIHTDSEQLWLFGLPAHSCAEKKAVDSLAEARLLCVIPVYPTALPILLLHNSMESYTFSHQAVIEA